MQIVYSAPNASMIYVLQSMLEERAIETQVRGEQLIGAAGELAPNDTWVQLLVVHDSDFEAARRIIAEATRPDLERAREPWRCRQCGELLEGQFGMCWNCGTGP